jgi:hypothetical protein
LLVEGYPRFVMAGAKMKRLEGAAKPLGSLDLAALMLLPLVLRVVMVQGNRRTLPSF